MELRGGVGRTRLCENLKCDSDTSPSQSGDGGGRGAPLLLGLDGDTRPEAGAPRSAGLPASAVRARARRRHPREPLQLGCRKG